MNIRAGQLRHRVTLLRPTEVMNDFGEPITTYQPAFRVWAKVEEQANPERARNLKVEEVPSYKITIRYMAEVDATWRVDFGGKLLDLSQVSDEDQRKQALTMLAYLVTK